MKKNSTKKAAVKAQEVRTVYDVKQEVREGAAEKFLKNRAIVMEMLEKVGAGYEMNDCDYFALLACYTPSFHDSGKIEGIYSYDSSCHGCAFCVNAINHAKKNPLLICGGCYADSQGNRWKVVKDSHALNAVIMSEFIFPLHVLASLPATYYNRFNSDGDVTGLNMAINYLNIARSHPYAKLTMWAKNVGPVIKAIDMTGKPENVRLIQSGPVLNLKVRKLAKYFDHSFTVYITEDDVQKAIATGSASCNGKKCKECGYACYAGTWPKGCDIAEILRGVTDKRRAELSALWTAYAESHGID